MSTATFVELAQRYLVERRALGFDLRIAGKRLLAFARFADERAPDKPLTAALAVEWARAATRASPLTGPRRLEVIRPFALWLRQVEARTEVAPGGLLGRAHRRLTPHLYDDEEIRSILREAHNLEPQDGLRPLSVSTLLGLLACTGLRVSEGLALRRVDVDLDACLLVVLRTKFKKDRLVPLHPTSVRALQRYAKRRDSLTSCAGSSNEAFFMVDGGVALTYSKVRTAFDRIRIRLGWEQAPGRRRRVHDLRHTFACRRLLRWHEEGVDVHRRVLDLQTYLGHAKTSDTYWYLSAFPELLELTARRFERFARRSGP